MKNYLWIIIGLSVLAGCAGNDTDESGEKDLTRQQKDSVLSKSRLPGASVVGGAISAADSAAARAKKLDDMAQ